MVYSPYERMEPRTFQAVERFVSSRPAKGRVDAMSFFLVAKAADVVSWTTSYLLEHKEERIAIPLSLAEISASGDDPAVIRRALTRHYHALDRFKYTLPLKEDTYFFGRESEVGKLSEAAFRAENVGLFGLRKTGKTSLLLKLERRLGARGDHLVHYVDAQSTSVRLRSWNQLLRYLITGIAASLQVKCEYVFEPYDAADDFAHAVKDLLSAAEAKRMTLIIDEVEWISPGTAKDRHWDSEFADFWHVIRSYQNREQNLNVIIAGVNPSMIESASFEGYQNPLFGIVSPVYLSGLSQADTNEMVQKIGKLMGIRFMDDALSFLYDQYGGHPLLTRLACSYTSDVAKTAGKVFPIEISALDLRRESTLRDRELVFYSEHVVAELAKFYPEEYALLERLAIGDYQGFVGAARDPRRAVHLFKYGIVVNPEAPYIPLEVVQNYVASENARLEGRATPYLVVREEDRGRFTKLRIKAIIEDMRAFEAAGRHKQCPSLFGPNSFPEADRLLGVKPPHDASSFGAALTPLHRSFVESVDVYGKSKGTKDYFFSVMGAHYPSLYEALLRIRTYRNHSQHLILHKSVDKTLSSYVEKDLEGLVDHRENRYWILFQRTLDELLRSLQREIARLSE